MVKVRDEIVETGGSIGAFIGVIGVLIIIFTQGGSLQEDGGYIVVGFFGGGFIGGLIGFIYCTGVAMFNFSSNKGASGESRHELRYIVSFIGIIIGGIIGFGSSMAIDIFAQLGFTLIGAFIGFLLGHAIGWLLGSVIDDATYSSDGIKSTPTKSKRYQKPERDKITKKSTPTKSIRNAKTTIHKPTKTVRYEESETEEISKVKPSEPAISFDRYLIFISEEVTEELDGYPTIDLSNWIRP